LLFLLFFAGDSGFREMHMVLVPVAFVFSWRRCRGRDILERHGASVTVAAAEHGDRVDGTLRRRGHLLR
jgi:hypothetical protein